MAVCVKSISVTTKGQGTYEITGSVRELLNESGIMFGMLTVFCRHTSCSLVIMENADPSARRDLEYYLNKLVPENDPGYTHTYEGADDMPSHIKMALTRTSEVIPVVDGSMCLGTWQGLFLWEHRRSGSRRELSISIVGE